jgi:hypothetical protein
LNNFFLNPNSLFFWSEKHYKKKFFWLFINNKSKFTKRCQNLALLPLCQHL